MYIKKLSIKNYRKYGNNIQEIDFAHSKWANEVTSSGKEIATENYISQSSTLIVGRNNSGKSTIIKLLKTLENARAGSKKIFKYTDFNLKMLSDWYKENIYGKSEEDIKNIVSSSFPRLEFQIILGIDDESDRISSFEDILVLSGITLEKDHENIDTDEIAEVTINIKYEVNDEKSFLEELVKLSTINNSELEKDPSKFQYQKELQYREFLSLFSSDYFILNFYPLGSDEPAKEFSLSPLLKVETIEANTVKSDETLSRAYNKIVSSYMKNHNIENIDDLVRDINYNVKKLIDGDLKAILQKAASSIESPKNLKLNLHPNVTLEKILASSIIYEYQEGENNIPESQFGMGYTNLMVIIATIVDYIELYNEDDINGSVNILCIEEPESFMHPQMQELFIKNISKAISILLDEKGLLSKLQVLITTHSPHILNSKIHSGNTLNNISYLAQSGEHNIIRNIKDADIVSDKATDKKVYEYIKKYLRYEISEIFFADAVVLIEGVTEEICVRYEIDRHQILKNNYIKVYRVDGAYAHKFITLLSLLGIKTIIFTDLDLKRNKDEKKIDIKDNEDKDIIPDNIADLEEKYKDSDEYISTNDTLKFFIKNEIGIDKLCEKCFNDKLIKIVDNKDELIIKFNNHVSLYSQGKINGYYATSFEEAIILTNGISNGDKNKESLIKLLKDIHPKMKYFKDLNENSDIVSKSYMYQVVLSSEKSKFSNRLVYSLITDEKFSIKMPQYIQSGLDALSDYFTE